MSEPGDAPTPESGWWLRRREASRLRREEARARRESTAVKKCAAPRCWARTNPGRDHCGLHGRL